MNKPTKLEQVKTTLIDYVEEFSSVLDDFANDNGELTCEENQWVCISNALHTVVAHINGLTEEDIKENFDE